MVNTGWVLTSRTYIRYIHATTYWASRTFGNMRPNRGEQWRPHSNGQIAVGKLCQLSYNIVQDLNMDVSRSSLSLPFPDQFSDSELTSAIHYSTRLLANPIRRVYILAKRITQSCSSQQRRRLKVNGKTELVVPAPSMRDLSSRFLKLLSVIEKIWTLAILIFDAISKRKNSKKKCLPWHIFEHISTW